MKKKTMLRVNKLILLVEDKVWQKKDNAPKKKGKIKKKYASLNYLTVSCYNF